MVRWSSFRVRVVVAIERPVVVCLGVQMFACPVRFKLIPSSI